MLRHAASSLVRPSLRERRAFPALAGKGFSPMRAATLLHGSSPEDEAYWT